MLYAHKAFLNKILTYQKKSLLVSYGPLLFVMFRVLQESGRGVYELEKPFCR